MEKRIIGLLIVACLISFLVGFALANVLQKDNAPEKELIRLQEELDWLKLELEMFYPPSEEEIYSINGTVFEKGEDFLVMESQVQVSQFPLPEREMFETRNIKVNVTGETEIFYLQWTDLSSPEDPAEPFRKVILEFDDINVGEYISVASAENIKDKTEITASEIELYY